MLRGHPYAGPADLDRLTRFLMECRSADPVGTELHAGDLLWAWRDPVEPARNLRLWSEPGGRLVGFTLADPRGGTLQHQVRPDALGRAARETIFGWGLDRLTEAARTGTGPRQVAVTVNEDNGAVLRLLAAHGFVRAKRYASELVRSLELPPPEPELPAGFAARPLGGEHEVEAYVALHRAAWARWGPSSYTVEAHRRLMRGPGYDTALNPVAVAPDGTLAAGCIGWLDPLNRIGEVEPLGTHPAYERRGLGRAVVLALLAEFRRRGMATGLVYGVSVNLPALRLYASLGFVPARRRLNFTQSLLL